MEGKMLKLSIAVLMIMGAGSASAQLYGTAQIHRAITSTAT